jgi:uncharacterized protein YndB with AHSA1/START domain
MLSVARGAHRSAGLVADRKQPLVPVWDIDPMSKRVVVERVIPAQPQAIFDVLADPDMHPVIDGSGTVRKPREGNPIRLDLGATFGMDMRMGAPYKITNTVVEFEEGRRIAWQHFAKNVWMYELEPVDGGTKVTETFDYSKSRWPRGVKLVGFPRRNRKGMERTLERLEKHFTSG